jgi:hypothetical protein
MNLIISAKIVSNFEKKEGQIKCVNELVRSLKTEELEIIREWADRALRDAQGAQVLTDEILNCSIRLLHKGGDTRNKPSDWRLSASSMCACS